MRKETRKAVADSSEQASHIGLLNGLKHEGQRLEDCHLRPPKRICRLILEAMQRRTPPDREQ